jgi:hypothetical protein
VPTEEQNGEATNRDDTISERSFDDLAKGLASGSVSRRRALKMMSGALVGGLLASIPGVAFAHHRPDHTGVGGGGCPSGVTCRGQCCPVGASCAGRGRNQACACPTGQTVCGGACTDLATDVLNCGSCGNACATGVSCAGGQCSVVVCEEDQNLCPSTNTCMNRCQTFDPELGVPFTDAIFNPTTCQCECQPGSTNISDYEPETLCCPDAQACGGDCCPEGYGCANPEFKQCEPFCTGATNCCCSCTYRDNTTGNFVSGTCDSASTLSYEQCQQQCETNAPPNTTTETSHFCAPVDYTDQQGNPIPTNVMCSGDYNNTPSGGGQCVVIQCAEA